MGPQEDYIETVVTCEGDFYDPGFSDRLQSFQDELKSLLLKDKKKQLVLKKVEPWNSVKVTFNIPKQAALRLKQLAEQGDPMLRRIGILGVQIQGDSHVSLTVARPNNQRAELVFSTADASQTASTQPPMSVAGSAGHGAPPQDKPGSCAGVNIFQDQFTSDSKVVHPSAEANGSLICTKSHLQSNMNNTEVHAFLELANTSGFQSRVAASFPTPSASSRLAAPPAVPASSQNLSVHQSLVQQPVLSPCVQQTVTAPFPPQSQPGSLQMARTSLHMAAEAGNDTNQLNIVPPLQPIHEKGTNKAAVRKRKRDPQESNLSMFKKETNNNALAADDKPKKRTYRRRSKKQMVASGSVDDCANAAIMNSNPKVVGCSLAALYPHLLSLPFTPHGGSAEVMDVRSSGDNYKADCGSMGQASMADTMRLVTSKAQRVSEEEDSLINPHTGFMEPRNSSSLSGTSTVMHRQHVVAPVDRSAMLSQTPSPCSSSSPHPPSFQFHRAEPPTRPDLLPAGQGGRTTLGEAWGVEQCRPMVSQIGSYQPATILHMEPRAKKPRFVNDEHLMNDTASVAQPMESDGQMFHSVTRGNLTSTVIGSGARELILSNSSPSGSSSRLFSDGEDNNSSSQSPISQTYNMLMASPLQDAQGKLEHQDSGIGSQSDRSVDTTLSDVGEGQSPLSDPSVAGKPLVGLKKLMNSEVKKEPVMPAGYMPTDSQVAASDKFSNNSKAMEHHAVVGKQRIAGCQEVSAVKREPDFGTLESCALVANSNSHPQKVSAMLKSKRTSLQPLESVTCAEQNRPTPLRQAFFPRERFSVEHFSGSPIFDIKGSPAMNTQSFSLPTSPLTVHHSVPFGANNLDGLQQTVRVWPKLQSMELLQRFGGGRQIVSEQKSLHQVAHEQAQIRVKKESCQQNMHDQTQAASVQTLIQQIVRKRQRQIFPQQIVHEQIQATSEQKLLQQIVHEQTQATSVQKSCQNAHGQTQLTSGQKSLQVFEQVQPTLGQKPHQQIAHGYLQRTLGQKPLQQFAHGQAQKSPEQNGARAGFEGVQQHAVSRAALYPPSLAAANGQGQLQRPQSQGHTELQRPHSQGHTELQRPQSQGHTELQRPHSQGHTELQRPQSQGHTELQRPHSQGHTELQRPHSQGHTELQRPHSQGHTELQRPHSQGHTELQRPLSVPNGNNSFPSVSSEGSPVSFVPNVGSPHPSAPNVGSPHQSVHNMGSPHPYVHSMGSPHQSVHSMGSPHPYGHSMGSPHPYGHSMGSPHQSVHSMGSPHPYGHSMGSPHPYGHSMGSPLPYVHNVKSPLPCTSVRSPRQCVSVGTSQHATAPVRSPYPSVLDGNISHQSVPNPMSQQSVPNPMSLQRVPNPMSQQRVPNPMSQQSVPNPMSHQRVPNPMPQQSVPNPMSQQRVPNPMPQQSVPNPMSQQSVPNPMPQQSVPNPMSQQSVPNPMSQQSVPNPMPQQSVPNPMSQQSVPNPISQQSVPNPMSQRRVPNPMSQRRVPNSMSQQRFPNPVSQQSVPNPIMSQQRFPNPVSQQSVPNPIMSQQRFPNPVSQQSVPNPIMSQQRFPNPVSQQSVPYPIMSQQRFPNPVSQQSVPNPIMSQQRFPNPVSQQSVPNPIMSQQRFPNPMSQQSVPNPIMSQQRFPNPMSHQSVPNPMSLQRVPNPMSQQRVPNPMSQQSVPNPMSQQSVPNPMSQQSGLKSNILGVIAAPSVASDHRGSPHLLSYLRSDGKETGLMSIPGSQGQQRGAVGESGILSRARQSGGARQSLNTMCGSVSDMKQSVALTAGGSMQNSGSSNSMKQPVTVACGSVQNNGSGMMKQSVEVTAACGSLQSRGSDITSRQSATVTLDTQLVEDKHHPSLPADASVFVNQPLKQCSSTSSHADPPVSTAQQSSAAVPGDFSFLDTPMKAASQLSCDDYLSVLESEEGMPLLDEIDIDQVIKQMEVDDGVSTVPPSHSPATSIIPPVVPSLVPAGTTVGVFHQDESAGLPQPRNLTESVQRVVKPLPAQDQHLSLVGIASRLGEAGSSLPSANAAVASAAAAQVVVKAALDISGVSAQKSSPQASWVSGSAVQQGVPSPVTTPIPHLQGSMLQQLMTDSGRQQSFPVAKNNRAAAAAASRSAMGSGPPPTALLGDAVSTSKQQTKGKMKKNGQPRKKRSKQQ